MVKKEVIILSAFMISVCLFSACAVKDNEESDWQITGQSQAVSLEDDDNHVESVSQTSAHSQADAAKVTEKVENLTEKTTQGVCIDYVIRSYEDVQNFGYELFAQNIHEKNPVLSPVSAYLALSMAGCGADGATWDEFYTVLGDMEVFSDDMMNNLPQSGDLLKLSIANSAWIDDEFIADDAWLGTVKSLMKADAFQVNLSTENAMNSMNSWIADQTNGMIDKMIDVPLDAMTRLVLFDTVYFKGKWETPFESWNTHQEDFYIDQAQNIASQNAAAQNQLCGYPTADTKKSMQYITEQVDMMNLYMTYLDYISNDFAEGVILPYQNNAEEDGRQSARLALIALKPTNDESIRDVYSKLSPEIIKNMLLDRKNEVVNLKLPKFEVVFDRELNKSLINMGLTECFDLEKADFSHMGKSLSGYNIYISLVRQKAKIIVDEEGTEAAAVTEIEARDGGGMLSEPKELFFNEPFLYMIMDMDRELPLFIGILDNPKGE